MELDSQIPYHPGMRTVVVTAPPPTGAPSQGKVNNWFFRRGGGGIRHIPVPLRTKKFWRGKIDIWDLCSPLSVIINPTAYRLSSPWHSVQYYTEGCHCQTSRAAKKTWHHPPGHAHQDPTSNHVAKSGSCDFNGGAGGWSAGGEALLASGPAGVWERQA